MKNASPALLSEFSQSQEAQARLRHHGTGNGHGSSGQNDVLNIRQNVFEKDHRRVNAHRLFDLDERQFFQLHDPGS